MCMFCSQVCSPFLGKHHIRLRKEVDLDRMSPASYLQHGVHVDTLAIDVEKRGGRSGTRKMDVQNSQTFIEK